MEKIYSKFVKERRKKFQIETAVWQEQGRRIITKRNLHKEGEQHIKNIYDTFLMYEKKEILCGASLRQNIISFEYVSGRTFEEVLLEAVSSGKREEVLRAAQRYERVLSLVCSEDKKASISEDAGFVEVFGAVADSAAGYRNAVFDLTFDNIICQEHTDKVIDYEWRFPFAVEKEFIKFRAVYAFLMKYSESIGTLYTKEEFYALFGLDASKYEIFIEYNNHFIQYIYGRENYQQECYQIKDKKVEDSQSEEYQIKDKKVEDSQGEGYQIKDKKAEDNQSEGYNDILQKYKKYTMNVCEPESLKLLKAYAATKTGDEIFYENRIYDMLLHSIEEHQSFYDDYRKFFEVTDRVKAESPIGYLFSKEFYEEFGAYLKGFYDMLEYYKAESEQRQQVTEALSGVIETKTQENIALQEKYTNDCELLTNKIRSLEAKLQYIESCKAYRAFLAKKVEERFE